MQGTPGKSEGNSHGSAIEINPIQTVGFSHSILDFDYLQKLTVTVSEQPLSSVSQI